MCIGTGTETCAVEAPPQCRYEPEGPAGTSIAGTENTRHVSSAGNRHCTRFESPPVVPVTKLPRYAFRTNVYAPGRQTHHKADVINYKGSAIERFGSIFRRAPASRYRGVFLSLYLVQSEVCA